jgi:exodeoxyribonuclease VII large subunit
VSSPRILSVGTIASYLKDLVESDEVLTDMWVEGEVSSFTVPASGHGYFTIKDDQSAIDCVIWKAIRQRQSFQPRPGDRIVVHGGATVYERTSRLQISADVLYPAGAGILQLQLEQLRLRLEAEGLFDVDRKRPLPTFPRRIGVVTSPTGSVWHDIRRVLERRYPIAEVILSPAVVQGEAAPDSVVAALDRFAEHPVDVIIVARGGGSAEDLWAFNDERLVRAMFAVPVPIVSAIGHETDTTLADHVADQRAATPSVAAELVSPDLPSISYAIEDVRMAMYGSVLRGLQQRIDQVAGIQYRLGLVSPAAHLETMNAMLQRASERLERALRDSLGARTHSVEREVLVLEALDPAKLLSRGYAWVAGKDDHLAVRSARGLRRGDGLQLTFADSSVDVAVTTDPVLTKASSTT